MLVLTRRVGEQLVIAGNIRVTVVSVHGERVRIGITAPRSINVAREEVLARQAAAAQSSEPAPVMVAPQAMPAAVACR